MALANTFPDATLAERKETLRLMLRERRLDAILIYASNKESSFSQWTTGAKPRIFHYFLLTAADSRFLAIDYHVESLRLKTAEPITPIIEDLVERDLAVALKPFHSIGIAGSAPFGHLRGVYQEKKFVFLDERFHMLLLQKSDAEIAGIAQSAALTKRVLQQAKQWIQPGIREKQLAREIRMALLSSAEDMAFPMTVMSGPRLARATAGIPTGRQIDAKDIVCIDAGVIKNGFASDLTRMYFLEEPEAKARYRALRDAHDAVIAGLKTGLPIREIATLYKEELAQRQLPAETLEVGDLGHSIGFNVHEYPFIYRPEYDQYRLLDRMVFTLEPEIAFPAYRLRVEDMVVMRGGKAEKLT
jgi:Xaa-Pro aminopeptidase